MQLTVGTKIGGGVALALLVVVIIGGASYRSTRQLIATARAVAQTHLMLERLERVLGDLSDVETSERGYLLTGAEQYLEPYQKTIVLMDDTYLSSLRTLTAQTPAQRDRLAKLELLIKDKLNRSQANIAVRKDQGLEAAVQAVLTGKGRVLMDQIRGVVAELKDEETRLLERRSREADASARWALAVIMWGIPLAVIGLGWGGLLLARHITQPLQETTTVAERMALGDLSVTVQPTQRRDETGRLLDAFARMVAFQRNMAHVAEQISTGDLRVNVVPQSDHDTLGTAFALMVANLQQLTVELTNAINLLGMTAAEIVAATAQLATSSTATATSMAETSTTVEQVRHTTDLASHQAEAVATNAQQTVQISQSGQQSTTANLAGMVHIRQQMDSITASMAQLSEQAETIGQVIATVDDIAAQSNLLAVNAAIEAAQAGEHGKGFAVVAQEISSLADQSKQATRQVRRLLADIQQAATAARRATDQGAQAVATGLEQSQHAGETIQALAGSVAAAAESATQIAVSSRQQLTGVDQLATAMARIQQASVQNVTSAQQLEISARGLSELGEKLRALVEQYKA